MKISVLKFCFVVIQIENRAVSKLRRFDNTRRPISAPIWITSIFRRNGEEEDPEDVLLGNPAFSRYFIIDSACFF